MFEVDRLRREVHCKRYMQAWSYLASWAESFETLIIGTLFDDVSETAFNGKRRSIRAISCGASQKKRIALFVICSDIVMLLY
jgi:hypothetical protein